MEDSLTLVLNENRVNVHKGKLASKSRYFAALFSHNFNDSSNKEHIINYDIDLCTLQNFVEWIHDDNHVDTYCHSIKSSMTKFMKDNFVELINLLQLSTLFVVEELTNDVVEIIVLCWLLPERVIDIWLLSQELGIKILQDICLSVCLDRFEELPLLSLLKLTKDNLTRLLENVNVRSSIEHLYRVIDYCKTSQFLSVNAEKERQLKFIQGIVIYETYEDATKVAHLYTWNGSVLSKCVQLKNMQESRKSLIGMQVASRGFNVYTIGGEWGLGTGHFNDIIWRYCLLSRKWYYQAKLRYSRRHMVAAFLKNKLVIVGGVGKHRLKLFTVDILDIHTGQWRDGARIPESFTDVPPHCVLNEKLFLIKSSVYIYHPKEDYWQAILIHNNPVVQRVDAFLTRATTLFLTDRHLDETVLSKIDVAKESICNREECLKQQIEHIVLPNTNIVYEDDLYELRYVHVAGIGIMVLNMNSDDKYEYLHLHTEIRKDIGNCFIPKVGCLNIMDPNSLYDTV
ncbi:hypothetical protein ANTPLA_LOCUS10422 [Anthophora plagiata]